MKITVIVNRSKVIELAWLSADGVLEANKISTAQIHMLMQCKFEVSLSLPFITKICSLESTSTEHATASSIT